MKKFASILMTLMLVMSTVAFGVEFPDRTPTALNNVIGGILGFVKVIGYAFAIGMLLYIGIKYTMASANEKADLKKGSISYVIGAVIIFGATTIVSILGTLTNQVVVS